MISEQECREVEQFVFREARLADEARYDEWEALWTDDALYWVPRLAAQDPEREVSHIYDNRPRLRTRIVQLKTGTRYSQEPPSNMRRVISNLEPLALGNGEIEVQSNFMMGELALQSTKAVNLWCGRTTHRLRRVDGEWKMAYKKVVLINGDEPIPNLAFLP